MKLTDILFTLSLRSIRLNMLRSILSALGITIGVIAISAMGMLGANMTLVVTEQMTSMANTMVVTHYTGGGGGGFPGMSVSTGDDDYVSESEFTKIKQTAGKYGTVYPVYTESSETIFTGRDEKGRATVYGLTSEDMQKILTVQNGTFPRSESDVVIGSQLAERQDLRVGSKITIGDEDESQTRVRVSGILASRGLSMDIRTDSAIVATDTFFTNFYNTEGEYSQVTILLDNVNDSAVVRNALVSQLNRKEDTISISDSSRMASTVTSTISTLTTFIMAIAAISLLVAAVSIFNVMMMSVTERIHEIGILRSIGTQKDEIMRMFVYEASVIGVLGSAVGASLSFAIGYIVVAVLIGSTKYFFTWQSLFYLPLGVLIGTAICLASGLYPAWRAANLDPVEALRAE